MPTARERLSDAASPQMAVLRNAEPSSTQGTMTIPEAMRLRAISGCWTSDLSQPFAHQSRAEVEVISDRGDPRQQNTIGTALRPQVHPSAAGNRMAYPVLRSLFILRFNLHTGQLHAVIAIAIPNLQKSCRAHLQNLCGESLVRQNQQQRQAEDQRDEDADSHWPGGLGEALPES